MARRRAEEAQRCTEKRFFIISRSHVERGNEWVDAPASRNAGAFLSAFPRGAWERDKFLNLSSVALCASSALLCVKLFGVNKLEINKLAIQTIKT